MIIKVDESFRKDFKKLKNTEIQKRIIQKISDLERVETIKWMTQMKKMQGFSDFYRLRIWDYRIGMQLQDENILVLIRVAHRRDIYTIFP